MPNCNATNYSGNKCNLSSIDMPYFWYYDAHKRINKVFYLCQEHSNTIINSLLRSEISHNTTLTNLYRRADRNKGYLRDKISYEKKLALRDDSKLIYENIKKFKQIKNKIRNDTCRYCEYPLKEPENIKDQIGNSFSHADVHSQFGHWREALLFHTECGITFLLSKLMIPKKDIAFIRPKLIGQHLLEL